MIARFAGSVIGLTIISSAQMASAAPTEGAAAGKRVFLRCMACHSVEAGAPAKVGPNLSGVVGRKAGSFAGFRYSPAMAKASFKWDEATLDKWLTRPADLVPGTTMAFAGLSNADERKAVIAYLKKPQP